MPRYKCLIRGSNFIVRDEDEFVDKSYGFYTTRFVWAKDEEVAETKCLEKLKSDKWLSSLKSDDTNPAMVHFESIEKVKLKYPHLGFGKGFCLFEMAHADEFDGHENAREVEIEAHS
jgi:hypothetical protein